ncbi:MAG: hypothetical protein AAFN18_10185 [Cyanobacteria bacterium J06554_6]
MDTKRIKVSFSAATLAALKAIAAERGQSISSLVAEAAITQHLGAPYRAMRRNEPDPTSGPTPGPRSKLRAPADLATIEAKLDQLLALLETGRQPGKGRKPRWGPRLGVAGSAKEALVGNVRTRPAQALETGEPVHVDHLIEHFGGDNALKARLCQLGGRGPELFEGSLTHARKAAAITSALDPAGQSWLPNSSDRVYWVPQTPERYCYERLAVGLGDA